MSDKHPGGRPKGTFKNTRLHELVDKHGCTRAWAYQLLRREIEAKKVQRKELMTTR